MNTIAEQYNLLIKERLSREDEYGNDLYDPINDPLVPKIVDLFTEDMDATIDFLLHDCTEDQFGWLSEVFDEIVEKSQSHEFVDALNKLAKKYPEETKRGNIQYFIDTLDDYFHDK